MPRTVYYAAVSLDGFIADSAGGVGWLEPYNAPDLGYEAFLETVGAVVLGRATFEQMKTFGPWPYPGRTGLVVASQPVSDLPPGVRVVTAAELPKALAELRAATPKDTWVVGGGKTARACLDAGLLDELELYVIPTLLGDGIPLFEKHAGPEALALEVTKRFENGITLLRYRVARG